MAFVIDYFIVVSGHKLIENVLKSFGFDYFMSYLLHLATGKSSVCWPPEPYADVKSENKKAVSCHD